MLTRVCTWLAKAKELPQQSYTGVHALELPLTLYTLLSPYLSFQPMTGAFAIIGLHLRAAHALQAGGDSVQVQIWLNFRIGCVI